ncbi:hypothetical protein NIES4106_56960 (plasmid) [Fischerella sp. NIES-4106]|nr:hypothetical protein NIES4106_56960 [Fischerella sp. NIES-4106]
MQYQDILTIAIIALPTAFAALMLVDFLALTRKLIQQLPRQALALQPQTATSTCITNSRQAITTLQPIQQPITLPDPWTLPTEESTSSVTHDSLPSLLLLSPTKEKSKHPKPKRSKKTTAPISKDTPKHRGRTRKAAYNGEKPEQNVPEA